MSLAADSPEHSSSSDDFAATLEAELNTTDDASADTEEVAEEESKDGDGDDDGDEDEDNFDLERVKRRKSELSETIMDPLSSSSQGDTSQILVGSSSVKCEHPGIYAGMCMKCGQKRDDKSGVPLAYINKNLRLANDEITRLRDKDFKNMLRHKKLYLVLDLDHTLLNSAGISDITIEEGYLNGERDTLPDALKNSLFRVEGMQMMTKLRPFVHNFLEEANKLFEMYIYTMGERPYALEMAKLLDPGDIYFNSRIIARGDCTQEYQKGLDVVIGHTNAIVILDDTESVWQQDKENLILMDRYHFFASSCKSFGLNCKSLSELIIDESEMDGALATVLKVLQRIHSLFFDQDCKNNLEERGVRQLLETVRKEILKGCKIVFLHIFPFGFPNEDHQWWKLAEKLGATCLPELDSSVTHVVSLNTGINQSDETLREKYVVHPNWIEASSYRWQKQPEENFPVSRANRS